MLQCTRIHKLKEEVYDGHKSKKLEVKCRQGLALQEPKIIAVI